MSTESRLREPIRPAFTHRTRHAGGFLLMLAGVIGAIVGLGLLIAAAGGVDLFGLTAFSAGLAGGVVLVFSVVEFAGGWAAYQGHNWYGSMTAGVLGMVTFFTLPLDLIGTLLIALSESQFDREPTEEIVEEPVE